MSAISTYLEYIRSKIYAKDVRTAIVNAISQCYDDVNKPALQTEAMQAAVQAKIDAGQMAAYTVADGSFAGSKLANGAVTTAKLADNSVTWQKIASGAVHTGELADSAVTNVKLADSSVSEGKLASGAVTTAKIANGAVTGAKVGTGTLTGDNIANKAIGTAKIDDGAVTWQKLAPQAVHTTEIADGAVTSAKLGDVAVTTVKIANKAITKEKLADDVVPDVDPTLLVSGMPADAKVVGDEIADLKSDLRETENEIIRTAGVVEELECGLTEKVKAALLACFAHVAWISDGGQTYYDALEAALNASHNLNSISVSFNQGSAVVYDTDELYGLKPYLTVTATYDDGTTREVDNYTLSGTLTAGISTITVGYNKKSTTFNVNVTHQDKVLESITATFNSSASITTDNVLDDLRPYLTVRALYSDGTTETVRNYTLSGSLNAGTNTITITYNGKTATFTVNVTEAEVVLQSITANFNQGSAVIYTDNTLNDLKPYLTVIARYSNGTTQTVTNYTLSGTLTKGTSVITASYGGKTATFNVNVTKESVDVSEITDSLDTFVTNIDNGTYSAKYKVGNYIPIDLGTEGIVNMQVVAKDADELADGSGYAPVTLLAMNGLVTEKSWNQISSYINSDVKALIPEKIRNRISPVKKYTVENNNANYLTTKNLWIPSAKEVSAKSFGFSYETNGVEYDKIFKDNSSRRLKNGAWYWLRSRASINSSNRQYVADGDVGQNAVTATMAIRLGFCIGKGKSIVYSLPRTTTFNGISDYIDTGIQLAKDDTPFTIQYDIMDQLPQESAVYNQTTLYHCMHESEPYPGYSHVIQRDNADNKSLGFSFNGTVSNYDNVINYNSYSTNKRIRTVITKKSDGTISMKSKEENGTIQVIMTTMPEFVSVSETLLIGAYRTTGDVKGRFWKGIMYDFKIYNRAISDDEATAYLQEDHS